MSAAPRKSERIAETLRQDPHAGLDDLRRARMERQFLEAARARAGQALAAVAPQAERRSAGPGSVGRGRVVGAIGLGVALAAAAAAWLALRPSEAPRYAVHGAAAAGSAGGSEGTIQAGTELALASGESASVELFDLGVEVSERSRLRVEAVSLSDVRVALGTGEARFAFHPRDRGHQHVAISTPSARIEIVGTELTVRVDERGTSVEVHEGVVRVIPTSGEVELVRAGSAVTVPPAVVAEAEVGALEDAPTLEAAVLGGAGLGGEAVLAEGSTLADVGELVGPEETSGMEEGDAAAEVIEAAVPVVPAAPSERERLEAAIELSEQRDPSADGIFLDLAAHARSRAIRAEAWTNLGDVRARRHEHAAALEAYERAVDLSAGANRDNAIYAVARHLDREMHDASRARAGYARYLTEYPRGANAGTARTRVCALGGAEGIACE